MLTEDEKVRAPDEPRKLKCVARDDIPTKTEIQQHLGASLAQVLFDYSHREAMKLLDSIPSARLLQESPCTVQDCRSKTDRSGTWSEGQRILKSHVHHDILALGGDALRKVQAEIEAMARSKLEDEFIEKSHMLEAKKRRTIKRNAEEIHATYEEYFEATQHDLKEKLQADWMDAKVKHNKELQKAVVKTRLDTTHDVLRRMRLQTCYILTSLHNSFQQSLRAQKERMIADFNKIVRKQHVNLEARIREVERKKMEELLSQRYELEIRNATDIIYVLCMERLRNDSQIHAIHRHFEEKIKFLHEVIAKQDEIMNIMKKMITECRDKNVTLEEKLSAITKEFQKFINFALDTMPEHADFLLPLDLLFADDTNKEDGEQEKK
ncbi:hypothetical protein DMN91_004899 [Ooceraea biroi]|uniref:Uncharacterized protein n=1 Tax=Ooceraea biroi TaxID=2015173 RepID=A0A3L8DQG4_OOCBI|nr:hypothetical protein DMN91_004899 [Ooceraea biroi]